MIKKFHDPRLVVLGLSYLFGYTKALNKEIKKVHKDLGLNHLFTPSGIHLSSLLLLLIPIIYLLSIFFKRLQNNQYKDRLKKVALLIIYLLVFLIPETYPLKRLALFYLITVIANKYFNYKNYFYLFLITNFIDIALGTFTYSPGSFTYSYLFLGIILSMQNIRPKILLPLALLGGQIIVIFFQEDKLTFIGFIFNFILSVIFEFGYPILFLTFWSNLYFIVEWLLSSYLKLIEISASISATFGHYYPTIPILFLVLVISLKIAIKFKKIATLLLLLIHSENIYNFKSTQLNLNPPLNASSTGMIYTMPNKSSLTNIHLKDNGDIEMQFLHSKKCRLRSMIWGQYLKCR
ncbi:MAG: ComEC/Rec2 family competence protein [Oligoflexia bacterium]|nr:ComEC/Rec2 family competence protein [Oligoflexia bacterium]